jgi:primary-amine oxidase
VASLVCALGVSLILLLPTAATPAVETATVPLAAQAGAHPLDPLSAAEVSAAAAVLRASGQVPDSALIQSLVLHEPPKEAVLNWQPGGRVPREAFAVLVDWQGNRTLEAVVDLDRSALVSLRDVPGAQAGITRTERALAPALVRADPRWQAAMRRRGIEDLDAVAVYVTTGDPVRVAAAGLAPEARLLHAMSQYPQEARDGSGQRFAGVAALIDGVDVIVDMNRRVVAAVLDEAVEPPFFAGGTLPPQPPVAPEPAPAPLVPLQPEGTGFAVDGHLVRWGPWQFRYALHQREGLVLYQAMYGPDQPRSVLYRGSLSEMFVPYGDPDSTWTWHQPFDVGDFSGIGTYAHPLTRGIDVPANAVLLDEVVPDDAGQPELVPGVVGLYERDAGLLWSHWNADGDVGQTRRARQLVLTCFATVGNYDYNFHWLLDQDGTLSFAVTLTGILNAKAVGDTQQSEDPHGVLVAPHVLAPTHQHFFNLRLDLDVDGRDNRVVEVDNQAVPLGPENAYGNAIVTTETLLTRELGGRREASRTAARTWLVRGAAGAGGYSLVPGGAEPHPYFAPQAATARHAAFAEADLWVTRYRPDERYAAGPYPNQGHPGEGLPRWIAPDESLVDTDVVLWYTLGVFHRPRPEEWPVMAAHHAQVSLVPTGFLDRTPALGLPPSAP